MINAYELLRLDKQVLSGDKAEQETVGLVGQCKA